MTESSSVDAIRSHSMFSLRSVEFITWLAPSTTSSRKSAWREFSSKPWHLKHAALRIGRISALNDSLSSARAGSGKIADANQVRTSSDTGPTAGVRSAVSVCIFRRSLTAVGGLGRKASCHGTVELNLIIAAYGRVLEASGPAPKCLLKWPDAPPSVEVTEACESGFKS